MKRKRVAETAREAIQDGERTNGGNAPTRSADVPTFPFYPICGDVKGGPGAFFERRRAKSGRRDANLDWAAENDRRLAGGVRRLRRAAFDDESVCAAFDVSERGAERFRRDRARTRRFSPLFSLLLLLLFACFRLRSAVY